MKSFRDSKGRLWDLSIDVTAVRRVHALLGVLLTDLSDVVKLGELIADPLRLVDVCFAIVKPQADAANPPVSDEAFATGLAGDAIEQMADAFMAGLVDFFPSARVRAAFKTAIQKCRGIQEKVENEAVQRASQINEAAISEQIIATFPSLDTSPSSGLSATSPAGSPSTPAP